MKSHPGVNVSVRLAGVQELFGEAFPELHVRTATTPFPGVLGSESIGRKVLHYSVDHAFTPVDGLQLQTVEFYPKSLFVSSPFLVAAAGLQLAHGAGVGHGVHHSGCRDGVGECAFSKTCQGDKRDYSVKPFLNLDHPPPICPEFIVPVLWGEDRYQHRGNRKCPDACVALKYQYILPPDLTDTEATTTNLVNA